MRRRVASAWMPCATLLPALLLLAPRHARAQAASPAAATTAIARLVNTAVQNSPGLAWLRSTGYNLSAIPPDFSQNLNFAPTPVQSSSAYVNEALNVADATMAGAFAAIPGVLRCGRLHARTAWALTRSMHASSGLDAQFAQFEAAQFGPFKQARSLSIAPQLRFFFFRQSFGLPQSPRQVLQWLLDPTLQLVRVACASVPVAS